MVDDIEQALPCLSPSTPGNSINQSLEEIYERMRYYRDEAATYRQKYRPQTLIFDLLLSFHDLFLQISTPRLQLWFI